MDNNTLFNEEDEKEESKDEKNYEIGEDELNLDEGEDDIIPIEETGGGGRKILWTIVVLIIVGLGIYSFAKREQIREGLKSQTDEEENAEIGEASQTALEKFTWEDQDEESSQTDATVTEEDNKIVNNNAEPPKLEEFTAGDEAETKDIIPPALVVDKTPQPENVPPPLVTEGDQYIAAAQPGEGVTHLARRSLQEYLDKNNLGNEINAEQKIYIEDYLQKRTSGEKLALNQTEIFTVGLIDEAINAAKQLNEQQLKNLEKYSKTVVFP